MPQHDVLGPGGSIVKFLSALSHGGKAGRNQSAGLRSNVLGPMRHGVRRIMGKTPRLALRCARRLLGQILQRLTEMGDVRLEGLDPAGDFAGG